MWLECHEQAFRYLCSASGSMNVVYFSLCEVPWNAEEVVSLCCCGVGFVNNIDSHMTVKVSTTDVMQAILSQL